MTESSDFVPVAEPEPFQPAPVAEAVPEPVAAEPEQPTAPEPAPEPEPAPDFVVVSKPEPAVTESAYVVVSRDEVDEYASKGYRPGYVMLRP